jgi:hypothetical protein
MLAVAVEPWSEILRGLVLLLAAPLGKPRAQRSVGRRRKRSTGGFPDNMESASPRNLRVLWITLFPVIFPRPGHFIVSFIGLACGRVRSDAPRSLWRPRSDRLHTPLRTKPSPDWTPSMIDDRLAFLSLSCRELTEGLLEFDKAALFLLLEPPATLKPTVVSVPSVPALRAFLFPPLSVRVHSNLTSTWRSSRPWVHRGLTCRLGRYL